MGTPWSSIIAGTTAAFSAVATGGAWMAARRANSTAEAVARIERERWHADLTPQFRVTLDRTSDRTATLSVHLAGPLPLGQLDEIRVQVKPSDDMDRTPRLPGPPTAEQVAAHVWGPYKFTHRANGADVDGQTVEPFALRVGVGRPFSVEKTSPPHWQEGSDRAERWRDRGPASPSRTRHLS